jgi:hypothetical protein
LREDGAHAETKNLAHLNFVSWDGTLEPIHEVFTSNASRHAGILLDTCAAGIRGRSTSASEIEEMWRSIRERRFLSRSRDIFCSVHNMAQIMVRVFSATNYFWDKIYIINPKAFKSTVT